MTLFSYNLQAFSPVPAQRFSRSYFSNFWVATKDSVTTASDGMKQASFLEELRAYGTAICSLYSFSDIIISLAMKLHSKDQAPREGQQPAQVPVAQWETRRSDYFQFLVDSLKVYETFEEITSSNPQLSMFKSTGLERSNQLKEDLKWMLEYDPSLPSPVCGRYGLEYSKFIKELVDVSIPKFVCHYYNHYFAHTAGGRMIGKRMSDKLLEGKVLKFYQVHTSEYGIFIITNLLLLLIKY